MIQAVRKYKRVFQTGEQQRSHPATRKAVELIRNGRIGKIQSIIGYNYPSAYECDFPAQPIPEGLDWDRWCGPNEVVPYHTDLYLSRIPYEREPPYYTLARGEIRRRPGLDVVPALFGRRAAQLGLPWTEHGPLGPGDGPQRPGRDLGRSRREDGEGGLRRARRSAIAATPPARKTIIHYKYANGVVLTLSSIDPKLGGGATFIGDKGRITIFREGYECDPMGLDEDPLPANAIRVYESDNHMAELLRLRGLAQRPDHDGRDRAQRGHLVPPGQHRPLAGPPPEVGSGEGDLPRRRRGQPVYRLSETQGLRTAGTEV